MELKTNTAVRIPVGPLVDPTDGKTVEGALTVADMTVEIEYIDGTGGGAVTRIAFTPAASGSSNDMVLVTSSAHAIYDLELTAANVNWLGSGKISFYDVDGFLIYWDNLHVVSANYFDNKYGSTVESVNTTQISGSTDAADKLEESAETIVLGTASGTHTTTTMQTDISVDVDDKYNGRVVIFRSNTTTAALRGQATNITTTTASTNQLTFTALTTAPSDGDTFCIV